MNWKHYLAILAPYAAGAAVGIAGVLSHSQNTTWAAIGLLIVSALNHGNVLDHAAQGATDAKK